MILYGPLHSECWPRCALHDLHDLSECCWIEANLKNLHWKRTHVTATLLVLAKKVFPLLSPWDALLHPHHSTSSTHSLFHPTYNCPALAELFWIVSGCSYAPWHNFTIIWCFHDFITVCRIFHGCLLGEQQLFSLAVEEETPLSKHERKQVKGFSV